MRQYHDRLLTWSDEDEWTGRPGKTYERTGFAIHIPTHEALVLVDPPRLSDDEVHQLLQFGSPTHILLTCANHLRESEQCRRYWGAKLLIHHAGLNQVDATVDSTLDHQDILWDAIQVIHIPFVHYDHEVAFLIQLDDARILLIGDALSGGREDIGVPRGRLRVFSLKYVMDVERGRASLARLLDCQFDAIVFAHGSPVMHDAHRILEEYVLDNGNWIL